MSARPESWSRPASATWAPVVALVAAGLFFAAWAGLHYGWYTHGKIEDTSIYERYGDAMANGQVPYRDFLVEYPPAALPVFAIPSLVAAPGDLPEYRRVFEALMAVSGGAALALVAFVLAIMFGPETRQTLRLAGLGAWEWSKTGARVAELRVERRRSKRRLDGALRDLGSATYHGDDDHVRLAQAHAQVAATDLARACDEEARLVERARTRVERRRRR